MFTTDQSIDWSNEFCVAILHWGHSFTRMCNDHHRSIYWLKHEFWVTILHLDNIPARICNNVHHSPIHWLRHKFGVGNFPMGQTFCVSMCNSCWLQAHVSLYPNPAQFWTFLALIWQYIQKFWSTWDMHIHDAWEGKKRLWHTGIDAISVGRMQGSQDGDTTDGDIGAIIRMHSPKGWIPQCNIWNLNVGWPQKLYQMPSCVLQLVELMLLPPPCTLSIYAPIFTCKIQPQLNLPSILKTL